MQYISFPDYVIEFLRLHLSRCIWKTPITQLFCSIFLLSKICKCWDQWEGLGMTRLHVCTCFCYCHLLWLISTMIGAQIAILVINLWIHRSRLVLREMYHQIWRRECHMLFIDPKQFTLLPLLNTTHTAPHEPYLFVGYDWDGISQDV